MASNNMERLHTHDIELGVTDVLQHHISRHVVHPKPVSQRKLDFEHKRPRILRECMAEATGVFFYVFPGIAAVASFTVNADGALPVMFFGNILQVGFAFALGIAFAIITCAPVSGGHFNPAITLCFAIWQGFPWKKVPHYILSQIFGSFVAGLVLMGCYWPEIQALKAANIAAHGTAVFNGGAASILCTFPNPNQTNQGFLFFQEFFVDSFIGIIIWAVLDPANPFVSPVSAPFTIGLAYAVMVWGFAANSISTNLARDMGTRFVAAIFFGKEAFSASNGYSWISILVNIPATIFATGYYEFLIRDSLQKIGKGHASHAEGDEGLMRHLTKTGTVDEYHKNGEIEQGYASAIRGKQGLGNGHEKTATV
jgi:glycerol uptake facilitator-like aquaporin